MIFRPMNLSVFALMSLVPFVFPRIGILLANVKGNFPAINDGLPINTPTL